MAIGVKGKRKGNKGMSDIQSDVAASGIAPCDRDLLGHDLSPNLHANILTVTTPSAEAAHVPGHSHATGHWEDPDFPRSGWRYVEHRNLDEFDSAICQVCMVERLRFQHRVIHSQGFDLWASAGCASALCLADSTVIQQRDEQMRDEAESYAQRRVIVSAASYITGPLYCYRKKGSPLMEAGGTGCVSLLPFPRPITIAFHILGSSFLANPWGLCAQTYGDNCSDCAEGNKVRRGKLFGVAQYNLDLDKNPTRKFPTCRFAAVILRREDCQAIKTVTHNKPYDYTLKFIHTFGENERLEWVEIGAATCKRSESYLFCRSLRYMEEGEWNLREVMDLPSPPEPSVDLTGLEELE